jgi:YidC/Oxa1 family membrane protein insertase
MEQGRLIIAIALSFLVFILWEFLFVDKEQRHPVKSEKETQLSQPEKKTGETFVQQEYTQESEQTTPAPVAIHSKAPSKATREFRNISVSTPLYSAILSEKGAVFSKFALNQFRETSDPASPPHQMISTDLEQGNLILNFSGLPANQLREAVFKLDASDKNIQLTDSQKTLNFTWQSDQGVLIEKKYTFFPNTYTIGMDITVKNGSSQSLEGNLMLSLFQHVADEKRMYGFQGPCALIDNKLEQIALKDIDKKNMLTGQLTWLAIVDRYFIISLLPAQTDTSEIRLKFDKERKLENTYISPEISIMPQKQLTFEHTLFIGPKSVTLLKAAGSSLDKAVNFGWFDFIAKPCLWLMNKFYSVLPNYGLAIIILTVLTKLIMWPLGNKSYKSMAEMKKLQPLMAEIKEKYKGDKKRINEETMRLYKTYKVNPMGGCLPMIVQIPVFFALYRMLYEAIELRHAPFFGWINDLSAPDRLFHFTMAIPFMDPPYGIPVLTIVMGGTMFLQQKMSPPMGDATQAKLMMLMPIMFTFIFINFSSGLVLYWLVNNIISIAQQYYIQKKS